MPPLRRILGAIFAAVVALVHAGCGSATAPRSVVIVTLDTTRADALGCYGGPPSLTPAIDALARDSVLYERAYTTTPLTLPSHASLMTGLYPIRHAVRDNGRNPLPDAATTLAERATRRGLATAAVVASAVLDPVQGLAQGFAHYDRVRRPSASTTTAHYAERDADAVLAGVRRWLDERDPTEPFLLWVHFFDPHFPYEAPAQFQKRASGIDYHGEVAYVDRAVGDLVEELRARALLGETLVVLTADHGEGLGDHGEESHGTLCYDTTMRVPLLVRYPDGTRAGERSREIVSLVDVYPTVLDALALGPPGDVDGLSLWRRTLPAERGAYFESYYGFLQFGWSPIAGWIDARAKYLHGTSPELYELERDPDEAENRAATADTAPYEARIAELAARPMLAVEANADTALLEDLRSLGYAAAGAATLEIPHPLAATGLPAVRTRRRELRETHGAIAMAERGDRAGAIEKLSAIVGENPRNLSAQERLGAYLIAEDRFEDALRVLRAVLDQGLETGLGHNNVGHCLQRLGRNDEALVHFRRGLELDPTNPMIPENLALVLRRLGRGDEAEPYERLAAELRR